MTKTLSSIQSLKDLDLETNKISDISSLKSMTNLNRLWLNKNPLTQAQIDDLKEALPNCKVIFTAEQGTAKIDDSGFAAREG